MSVYIHQLSTWPRFTWNQELIDKKILLKELSGGRSMSYMLTQN